MVSISKVRAYCHWQQSKKNPLYHFPIWIVDCRINLEGVRGIVCMLKSDIVQLNPHRPASSEKLKRLILITANMPLSL